MNARIFAVEDDAPSVAALKKNIEKPGYEFAGSADNAEAAMEQISQLRPDLVLMDIQLSGAMDGIELAARLHSGCLLETVPREGIRDSGLAGMGGLLPALLLTVPGMIEGQFA